MQAQVVHREPAPYTFPKLLTVMEFAELTGLSRTAAYAVVAKMPAGIRVDLFNRLRLDEGKLVAWLAEGGHAR